MSNSIIVPSIFDAYNARQMKPDDVAATFVPPSHYSTLAKTRHTVLIGPRGSGKTTLLKMLQQPALEAWQHPSADEFRSRINFTGVFIPFDQSWNAQMRVLGSGDVDPEVSKKLSYAAFTTHMLKALITAMQYRCYGCGNGGVEHRRVKLERTVEARLVKELADAWYFSPIVPSLQSLKHALALRLNRIWEISLQETVLEDKSRMQRIAEMKMLHIHFLMASLYAVDIFNDLADEEGGKWALLFDELELAPDWVCRELTSSLRSFDDRFLFKLSISPFTADVLLLDSASAPMPGHDYDIVPLWYAHKEEGYKFCEDMLTAVMKRKGYSSVKSNILLGESKIERDTNNSSYRPGSKLQSLFISLWQKDPSFKEYVMKKDIDLNKLHLFKEDDRAKLIRKIMPLVIFREAFRTEKHILNPTKFRQEIRGRKNPHLYSGALALFTIVEGNPRWFLGIIGPLIEGRKSNQTVDSGVQSEAILEAAQKYRALLRTIPCPRINKEKQPRGLLTLLDTIGDYLFNATVVEKFDPDVPGSFVVDSHPAPELLASIKQALNAGAIVYVPDESGVTLVLCADNLKGKRFRLSYLLAADYSLPIRLGRPIQLSRMLKTDVESLPLFENGGLL